MQDIISKAFMNLNNYDILATPNYKLPRRSDTPAAFLGPATFTVTIFFQASQRLDLLRCRDMLGSIGEPQPNIRLEQERLGKRKDKGKKMGATI